MPEIPACPTNITYWTDDPISADYTRIKAIHINELREAVNNELHRRLENFVQYEDDPIQEDSDQIRKIHIDELRAALEAAKDAGACTTDNSHEDPNYTESWTDSTIEADITQVRKIHLDEMRDNLNAMETVCICDCNFCSCDCNRCCDYSDCKSCTHGW